ncbi:MAG: beta-ketoacyl synthase N-terminal-like domain-containing protein [bacterium]
MAIFQPIAIVGRSCVLPGALSPAELWDAVVSGTDLVSQVDQGRWRADMSRILCDPSANATDKTWSDRGGYVRGFERVWDPNGFGVPPAALQGLDPSALWALYTARQALADAGDHATGPVDRGRVTAVFGNLGFPTAGMSRFAEDVWTGKNPSDSRNRFMSGGTASLLREALGLGAQTYCIDCACASSLYAIKLACDQLHDGSADTVLAGAVNGSDDLFIHVGFTALQALSKTGQSRPFHAEADGLVPAEGAGFVALKRLADAQRDGNTIYGVIRGVGLSNDGRGRGFLAPLVEGQVRAIASAYEQAGISPAQVSLLECHATGTKVGDATELKSTAQVFGALPQPVAIGSLKSNMGHLITTAGVAALIKVTEAMRHGVRPPSLHHEVENPTLAETPFRVLGAAEPWPEAQKIAGISAFGFGGNNAHLVVTAADVPAPIGDAPAPSASPLAVVGLGALVGDTNNAAEFAQVLSGQRAFNPRSEDVVVPLTGLRFPPSDLKETIGQQVLALESAREAIGARDFSGPRTAVFLAMEPDVNVCRYGVRWRMELSDPDSVVPELTSAGVVGTMPNIPANRLNSQFDFGGASVTVSAGAQSGMCALRLAEHALRAGEIDTAVVVGVDLCNDSVQAAAFGVPQASLGDAAVTLVLKRLEDAQDHVLATFAPATTAGNPLDLSAALGVNYAAQDLRDLVALILSQNGDVVVGQTYPIHAHVPTSIALAPRVLTGPTLTFKTHGNPVNVPMTTQHIPSSSVQSMPAAPALPRVGTAEPSFASLIAGTPAAPAAAPAMPVSMPMAMPTFEAPTAAAGTLGAMHGLLQQVGEMQQQFLVQQSAVFAQFMQVQQQGMNLLNSAPFAAMPASVPSMPAMPAIPAMAPAAPQAPVRPVPTVAQPAPVAPTPKPAPAPQSPSRLPRNRPQRSQRPPRQSNHPLRCPLPRRLG